MTSIWKKLDVERKVINILDSVPQPTGPDEYGRPFISAYQLAVEMDIRYPEVRSALRTPVGGAGSGQPTSLTQYLAKQLAQQIREMSDGYPIEGGGLSALHLADVFARHPEEGPLQSSNTATRDDLSLFRRRDT